MSRTTATAATALSEVYNLGKVVIVARVSSNNQTASITGQLATVIDYFDAYEPDVQYDVANAIIGSAAKGMPKDIRNIIMGQCRRKSNEAGKVILAATSFDRISRCTDDAAFLQKYVACVAIIEGDCVSFVFPSEYPAYLTRAHQEIEVITTRAINSWARSRETRANRVPPTPAEVRRRAINRLNTVFNAIQTNASEWAEPDLTEEQHMICQEFIIKSQDLTCPSKWKEISRLYAELGGKVKIEKDYAVNSQTFGSTFCLCKNDLFEYLMVLPAFKYTSGSLLKEYINAVLHYDRCTHATQI